MKLLSLHPGWLAALVSIVAAGCDRGSSNSAVAPSAAETRQVTETGQVAAKALMASLGGQLKAALQSGGPVEALQVCQQAAQPITSAAGAQFEGVTIHRTTLKPRNPANAPDEIDRAVLEKMTKESSPLSTVEWQDGVARYYQPVMIQEICLKCHGAPASFPAELTAKLADLYPVDQATGYAVGDFRGVIRVDVTRP